MRKSKRIVCMAMAVLFAAESAMTAMAAGTPQCDETLYVTMDPYGEIVESSVVKNYLVNGSGSITDYGTYGKVTNLTDNGEMSVGEDGSVTFTPEDQNSHFYFEGQTDIRREQLPWNISVGYRLNGVEKKAEELGGEKGLVEINVDLVPNKNVSDYYRNNMTLMASAIVDMDKNLSLEAEGAQVQCVGNLNTVVFFALPGEENHYSLRIGTDDFSFSGLVFAMVPLTVSQLDKVADIREAKETLEDTADAANDSLDVVLNSLSSMQKSIDDTADGIRGLNETRQLFADSKGKVYADADEAMAALDRLSGSLDPFYDRTETAVHALNQIQSQVNNLVGVLEDFSPELGDTRENLRYLRDEVEVLQKMLNSPEVDLASQAIVMQMEKVKIHLDAVKASQTELSTGINGLKQALPQLMALSGSLSAVSEEFMDEDELNELIDALEEEGVESKGETRKFLKKYTDLSAAEIDTLSAYLASELGLESNSGKTATPSVAAPRQAASLPDGAAAQLAPVLNLILDGTSGLAGNTDITDDIAQTVDLAESLLTGIAAIKGDINGSMGGIKDLLTVAAKTCSVADDLISSVDDLNWTVNNYHDDLTGTLREIGEMTTEASKSVTSLNVFFRSMESQLKTIGDSLNSGTKKTLNGLAGVLDEAGNGLSQTEVLQNAKDTIKNLIHDKWDEYTTEDTTILNIDLEASPKSFTSEKNPAPRTIQMIIRTGEIKKSEEVVEAAAVNEDFKADGSIFHRIANIFRKIWQSITSIFK